MAKSEQVAYLGVNIPFRIKARLDERVRQSRPRVTLSALVSDILEGWDQERAKYNARFSKSNDAGESPAS